jgi:cytochrome P450
MIRMPPLIPPRVAPAAKPLGRLASLRAFVRNPLEVLPRAVYEEDFVAFGAAKPPRAWVTSPALVKAVLLDEREKFAKLTQIRLLGPLLGKGILTSEGADWKWQRQASAPMFRPQELAGFVPAFVRRGRWSRRRAKPADSVHAIDDDMTHATFDVIAATLLPSADAAFARTVQASVQALQRFGPRGILYASLNVPQWAPHPGMFAQARFAVNAALHGRGAGARAQGRPRSTRRLDAPPHRRARSRNRPHHGRRAARRQPPHVLPRGPRDHGQALTWTLYLLARSPDWTAVLEDEIARGGQRAVRGEHVDALVCVKQVVKESMRSIRRCR